MSTASIEPQPARPSVLNRAILVSVVLGAISIVAVLIRGLHDFAGFMARFGRPHAPDFSELGTLPLPVLLHLVPAIAAIGLGVFMMASRKGRKFHRIAGWIWTGLVMSTALVSLFIQGTLTGTRWSPLHLGSAWVIVFLPLAVLAARRHRVGSHRALMMLIFYGTLLITFALAFLPGRFMWRMFFG